MGVDLAVLKPQDFELVVATAKAWEFHHRTAVLRKPHYLIARKGAETRYMTFRRR